MRVSDRAREEGLDVASCEVMQDVLGDDDSEVLIDGEVLGEAFPCFDPASPISCAADALKKRVAGDLIDGYDAESCAR